MVEYNYQYKKNLIRIFLPCEKYTVHKVINFSLVDNLNKDLERSGSL